MRVSTDVNRQRVNHETWLLRQLPCAVCDWWGASGDLEAILIIIVSDYEIQHLGESIPEDWAPWR